MLLVMAWALMMVAGEARLPAQEPVPPSAATGAAEVGPEAAEPLDQLAWMRELTTGLDDSRRGNVRGALDAFEAASARAARAADAPDQLALSLNNLARMCSIDGQDGAAEINFRRALELTAARRDVSRDNYIIALHNLHAFLVAEGRNDEAETLIDRHDTDPVSLIRDLAATEPFSRAGATSLWLIAPSTRFITRKILIATDRAPFREPQPAKYFSSQRGELMFGTTTISLPLDATIGSLREPSMMRLEFGYDPERHVTILDIDPQKEQEFFDAVAWRLERAGRADALLYVHGFNESLEGSARVMAQMTWDLGYDGVSILYSWPSLDELSTSAYVADRQNAEWTIPHLAHTIERLAEVAGEDSLCLVAHSLGNQPLLGALQEIANRRDPHLGPIAREVVMVAPDIDAGVFAQRIGRVVPLAQRVTMYVSSNDRALQYSSELHGDLPRAGDSEDGIMVIDGVDTIEVSEIDATLIGHHYYRQSRPMLSDMYYLMTTGAGPERRHGLRPIRTSAGNYWKFRP
jgi:esterase/lipase superfamily enzyme